MRRPFSVVPSGRDVTVFGAAYGETVIACVDEATDVELFADDPTPLA